MLTATKRAFKASLVTVITILFLVFAVVNRGMVHLSLFPLPYTAEMPTFLFAIFCFAIGLTVGWIAVSLKLSRNHRLLKSEHKRVMALQNELSLLQASRSIIQPGAIEGLDSRLRGNDEK